MDTHSELTKDFSQALLDSNSLEEYHGFHPGVLRSFIDRKCIKNRERRLQREQKQVILLCMPWNKDVLREIAKSF